MSQGLLEEDLKDKYLREMLTSDGLDERYVPNKDTEDLISNHLNILNGNLVWSFVISNYLKKLYQSIIC